MLKGTSGLSQKVKNKAKNLAITPELMAYADLIAAGWDLTDAYAMTIRTGTMTWQKKVLDDECNRLLNMDGVQARIHETKNVRAKRTVEKIKEKMDGDAKEILERATSKERKLVELQTLIEGGTLTPGSAEYNKINDQIIQVSQMKKDEIKTEDTTIHYFLPVSYPVSCKDCLRNPELLRKYRKKHMDKMEKQKKQQEGAAEEKSAE